MVVYEEYVLLTQNFTNLILKAQEAEAKTLLALPNPPDGVTIFKQMGELGYTPDFTFFVRAPDVPTWSESLGAVGDFVAFAPGWHTGPSGGQRGDCGDRYGHCHRTRDV